MVQRHAGWVHGVCRRVCGSHAEDAVQECFWELARQSRRIRGSVAAWLHCVAVRTAVRHRQRPTSGLAVAEAVIQDHDQLRSAWQRLAPLVDTELAALPADLREVVTLHFFAGLTQVEIAERCGVSQATISRRLNDGVAALRRRLRAPYEDLPLAALLPCGLEAVPPELLGRVQRIGLAGPTPLAAPPTLGVVAGLAGLALTGLAIFGVVHTPSPGPTPLAAFASEPVMPPLPATPAPVAVPTVTLSVIDCPAAATTWLREWLALPLNSTGYDLYLESALHAGWLDNPADRKAWDEQRQEIEALLIRLGAEDKARERAADHSDKPNF